MSAFSGLLLVCAFVFILTGIITLKFPPKQINSLYGYRTKASMMNNEAWEKAQKLSSRWLIFIGLGYAVLAPLGHWLQVQEVVGVLIALAVLIVGVVVLFIGVERALNQDS